MAKKKITKYFSNSDLRWVEALYTVMKSYPGFYMPNVFTYGTREYYAVYEQMYREFARANRSKYRDRNSLSTAVHETGHAVVGAASRWEVYRATIIPSKNRAGHVSYTPESENAPDIEERELIQDHKPMPDQLEIRRDLVITAAGFVAEHDYLGRYSTAYHEKLIVYFQTRYLDEQEQKPAMTNWHHFTDWTSRIIKENSKLFELTLADILANKDLSENGRQHLNKTARTQEVNLFFN
ncbi:MAG: hypothetical protein NMNS01_23410 [Nitrosomonas sp.]|nr:MAG: hypothetical protein NMNS01_23410 [Nitrosomonas sp.]